MPRAAAPPAVAALLPPPAPSSHRPHPPPWGAALCDRLCFASSVSALAERATAAAEGTRPLLSLPRCPPPAHEPTRRDVLHLAWPHAVWLLLGCVALACRLPFSLAMPHLISEVIGALVRGDAHDARRATVLFFGAGVLDSVGDFFCVFLFSYCQQKIIRSLRVRLFACMLKQEVGYFDQTSTGSLTSRLSADCAEMANDLTWVFRFAIEAMVRIGGILGYMFWFEWRLACVAVAIIPVVAAINKFYGDWLNKNATRVQAALGDANAVAHEAVAGFRTVYSFAQEKREMGRYNRAIDEYYMLNVRQSLMQSGYYMFCCTFLGNCCVQAALLLYGTHLVLEPAASGGGMPVQTLLAFMLYQGQLLEYHPLPSYLRLPRRVPHHMVSGRGWGRERRFCLDGTSDKSSSGLLQRDIQRARLLPACLRDRDDAHPAAATDILHTHGHCVWCVTISIEQPVFQRLYAMRGPGTSTT
jgi:hypothetical protein